MGERYEHRFLVATTTLLELIQPTLRMKFACSFLAFESPKLAGYLVENEMDVGSGQRKKSGPWDLILIRLRPAFECVCVTRWQRSVQTGT